MSASEGSSILEAALSVLVELAEVEAALSVSGKSSSVEAALLVSVMNSGMKSQDILPPVLEETHRHGAPAIEL